MVDLGAPLGSIWGAREPQKSAKSVVLSSKIEVFAVWRAGAENGRKKPQNEPQKAPRQARNPRYLLARRPDLPLHPLYFSLSRPRCNFNRAERPLSVTRAIFCTPGPISLCTPSYSSHSEPNATTIGLNARFPSSERSLGTPARSPSAVPLIYRITNSMQLQSG